MTRRIIPRNDISDVSYLSSIKCTNKRCFQYHIQIEFCNYVANIKILMIHDKWGKSLFSHAFVFIFSEINGLKYLAQINIYKVATNMTSIPSDTKFTIWYCYYNYLENNLIFNLRNVLLNDVNMYSVKIFWQFTLTLSCFKIVIVVLFTDPKDMKMTVHFWAYNVVIHYTLKNYLMLILWNPRFFWAYHHHSRQTI